jgi:SAM-dependent methyltransferase
MTDPVRQIYKLRFSGQEEYRKEIWRILVKNFFSKWIPRDATVLDLGCGYGEFINNIEKCERHGMDLNPDSLDYLNRTVVFHEQDCSSPWPFPKESLDLIFTSNFFEHLPDKQSLNQTIANAKASLKKGGAIMALGPNISCLNGKYWDFWDHHIALSHESLAELFEIHDLKIEKAIARFLPYNMTRVKKRPFFLVKAYLKLPFIWPLLGKQFFIVAKKT